MTPRERREALAETVENIIRGAMLPVAVEGFAAIGIHAPNAARNVLAEMQRNPFATDEASIRIEIERLRDIVRDSDALTAEWAAKAERRYVEIERLRKVLEAVPDPQAVAMMGAEIERLRVEVEQYKALADVNDLNAWTDHVKKRVAIERADERRRTADEIKQRTKRAPMHHHVRQAFVHVSDVARICDEVGGSDDQQ